MPLKKQKYYKYVYLRMNPARYVVDDLTSIGSGKYTVTLTGYNVNAVKEKSTSLTKVTTVNSSGQYSFANNLLTIYPSNTPSETNPIVVYHYLFFTNDQYRIWHLDPADTATDKVEWIPYLTQLPRVTQAIDDLLSGIFSIQSSSISLLNDNFYFNNYLSLNGSFYNKEVKIWACYDCNDNIEKLFQGIIANISVKNESVEITIKDMFSAFNKTAFIGDSYEECYLDAATYTGIDLDKKDSPIPIFFGDVSPSSKVKNNGTPIDISSEAYVLDSTGTSRQWLCGKVSSSGVFNYSFTGTFVSSTFVGVYGISTFTVTSAVYATLRAGDSVSVVKGGATYYGLLSPSLFSNTSVDIVFRNTLNPNFSVTTYSIVYAKIPYVELILKSNPNFIVNPIEGQHFSTTETTTSGGNKMYKLTFINNLETFDGDTLLLFSIDPNASTLDSSKFEVRYRLRPVLKNHSDVLKYLVDATGLTTNASSFTNAKNNYALNCLFSIPNLKETEYFDYLNYVEMILKSTFGHLYLNAAYEIAYKVLDISTSSDTFTDTEILKSTFTNELEYQDIIDNLVFTNKHYPDDKTGTTTTIKKSSLKTYHLHGISKSKFYEHVLEDISSRADVIFTYLKNRKATYSFSTAHQNITSLIGDDITVSTNSLLDDKSKDLKIVSIEETLKSTTVKLTDLGE